MLFEEFFKKKKINLGTLQQGEPALFSEFKDHYAQMGEKSFDHTKKYWFNKLRRQFPLPFEVKAEKLRPENQMAEQTVADTLTEPSPKEEAPKLGFKPKFNPVAPPATNQAQTNDAAQAASEEPTTPAPKLGFKPKFKAVTLAAETPAEPAAENKPVIDAETPALTPPKTGFKPRFKAGVTATKPAEETRRTHEPEEETAPAQPLAESDLPDADTTEEQPATDTGKLGFKPRFKAGVTQTKPVEKKSSPEPNDINESTSTPAEPSKPQITPPTETPAAKPAYKPRFTPNMIKRKPPEEEQ